MDYYKILEVSENADILKIKKQYRKLAMKYHPDRNAGDKRAVKKFREITEAYEVLSNGEKRKEYDYKRENENNHTKKKNDKENFKNKYSENNFSFGKEFFKSAAEMKGMFENSFGLDKMIKNKAKDEKESLKSRFESFFDMKEKK
ncbi:DnaJ domain-containing protein [Leptotrichia massiliensis]|uniref:DnaJ domain-containing protein n=1 Tax=Leptotrichia massiliensis TaxID=1852388 RepID=UPI0028F0B4C9|nr:DnaJ domain-containing protein [Leptotrichia massiliensis]